MGIKMIAVRESRSIGDFRVGVLDGDGFGIEFVQNPGKHFFVFSGIIGTRAVHKVTFGSEGHPRYLR